MGHTQWRSRLAAARYCAARRCLWRRRRLRRLDRALTNAFLLSTYTGSTEGRNHELKGLIEAYGLPTLTSVPPRIEPGSIAIVPAASDATHHDFLLRAWTNDPLRDLLARVRGYPRS